MRIDITEKNMVWLVEHKMADTIVAEFHRKEAVIESLIRERDEARAELTTLRASSFVTAVPVEQYERVIKAGSEMSAEMRFAWLERIRTNKEQREAWLKKVHQCLIDWEIAKEGKQS